jgi:hypothetical protein
MSDRAATDAHVTAAGAVGARLWALAAWVAGATATSAFAGAHLRLVNEGASGPLYECSAAACERAQTDDPSRKNRRGMDFYVLPDGCVELRHAALRPAGPGVDVVCGPQGGSASYRCEGGTCRPLGPSDDDGVRARPIPLPADCGGRVHELIVLDARRRGRTAYVECDASSGPAGAP